jgi:hypothetical protein
MTRPFCHNRNEARRSMDISALTSQGKISVSARISFSFTAKFDDVVYRRVYDEPHSLVPFRPRYGAMYS